MDDYPLIADHGLIGDLQTAALVTTDGSIDWFCAPRFDSPSVFAALLDHRRGGRYRIRPSVDAFSSQQMYLPDTAILITRFLTPEGIGEIIDFMPVSGKVATDQHRLVRLVRCVRGRMTFEVDVAPRFDYGRKSHELHLTDSGAIFKSDDFSITVHVVREPDDARLAHITTDDAGDVHASLTLEAGQLRGLVLDTGTDEPPREFRAAEPQHLYDDTGRS